MELTPAEVWGRVRDAVRESLPEHAYNSWIAGVTATGLSENRLELEASNRFKAEWLEDKYRDLLEAKCHEIVGRPITVSVTGATSPDPFPAPSIRVETPTPGLTEGRPGRPDSGTPVPSSAARTSSPSWHDTRPGSQPHRSQPTLNERYTFDRFVVGDNNQLAAAAARAAAQQPGRTYNPLVLYGGVGLGKTHMMQAIGHELLKNDPDARIAYVSAEQFMNDLIEAIGSGTTAEFRARYREMDLLLVDDVQFFKGKETTQVEFFHTFNALYDSHRQIVLTSDRPPREMEGVEERLLSRFDWGLAVDLRPPDFETRVAILRKKAEDEGLVLDDDVIECIAAACTDSVRELEGAVLKLLAVSSVYNHDITVDFARRMLALRKREQERRRPIASPEKIRDQVARSWRVRPDSLASKTRTRNVTEARHVAMYAIRELLGLPLKQIGHIFGDRDHSTVLYSIQKVERRLQDAAEDDFRDRVTDALAELQAQAASRWSE